MLQIRTSDFLNFYRAASASAGENTASESIPKQLDSDSKPGLDKVSLSPVSRALSHDSRIVLKAMAEAPVKRMEKLAVADVKRRKGFYNTHDVAAKLADKLISAYPLFKNEGAGARGYSKQ